MSGHKIVDLFCGCGGFSLGAHLAGFETVLAVDVDPILSSAYARNYPNAKLVLGDLAKMHLKEHLGDQSITGIIGGPPCQGFSLMGKRDKNDPRNQLIGHFFRHVMEIRPAFFVMENVPGILLGDAYETLTNALKVVQGTYQVLGPIKVDASEFGAATKRSRVVVIGVDPLKMSPVVLEDILALKKERPASVKDAIGGLPNPVNNRTSEKDFDWIKVESSDTSYARKASQLPPKGVGAPEALARFKKGEISGLLPTIHTSALESRYEALPQGKTDPISRATKLEWSKLCGTLRAGTGSDKGSYQAVRPIHPEEPRVITVREAARLQGFPDWYLFHPTKWHSFRMIGNSVSPYMSEAIMTAIVNRLAAGDGKEERKAA